MLLKTVIDYLTKTYTTQCKCMSEPNLTQQDLRDLDSEIVSIESACKSLRAIIQNKRALGIYKNGDSQVASIKLIGDEDGDTGV